MDRDICFFEPNKKWASRLIDYWSSHGMEQYTIHYYSDEELFLEKFPKLSFSLWILDVRLKERLDEYPKGQVIWLTEDIEDVNAVFKFRSAAVLLQTVLGYLGKSPFTDCKSTGTQIISFYTPVRRSMQTTFAITLSHLLARKGRVLYLNLEGYSGFEYLLSGHYTKDISDFIYHFNHSKDKNPIVITNFIYKLGEVDMIPPVLNPANLLDISGQMWESVLDFLTKCGLYDYIVLDMGDFVRGAFEMLRMSHSIFSLVPDEERAMAKWQQYQTLLETFELQAILDRTHKIAPPHRIDFPVSLEEYSPGVFSDYVKEIASKEGLL